MVGEVALVEEEVVDLVLVDVDVVVDELVLVIGVTKFAVMEPGPSITAVVLRSVGFASNIGPVLLHEVKLYPLCSLALS